MTTNMGTIDRVLRLALGVFLLAAPFFSGIGFLQSGLGMAVAVIVGIVMVGTSALGSCPLYTLFGIRTCKM